ncbi:MAG TPA: hypothetical protein PK733_14125, partial [Clostridiales bacterium]|nr:hypothetical protein [Clostridiales bacterium]
RINRSNIRTVPIQQHTLHILYLLIDLKTNSDMNPGTIKSRKKMKELSILITLSILFEILFY